ncbi:hypothetical protein [Candidatus Thiosymbion oneisti]|uniref:hypothetical protein n=1 Tax=Candidatus Thiosymbion oneisti TaxID=589554 RepID=UPI0013FDA24B|nr:hypothetical protein [Candidatus Thiosymbion oneisti]
MPATSGGWWPGSLLRRDGAWPDPIYGLPPAAIRRVTARPPLRQSRRLAHAPDPPYGLWLPRRPRLVGGGRENDEVREEDPSLRFGMTFREDWRDS